MKLLMIFQFVWKNLGSWHQINLLALYILLVCISSEVMGQVYFPLLPTIEDQEQCTRTDSLLIYADTRGDYSLPTIETILESLQHAYGQEKVFCHVENLNRLVRDDTAATRLRVEMFRFEFSSEALKKSEAEDTLTAQVRTKLRQHGKFLRVSINEIQELLEYQFVYHDNIPEVKSNESPLIVNRGLDPTRHVSAFLNPRSPNFLIDLENTLKRVIPESNAPPLPVLEMTLDRDASQYSIDAFLQDDIYYFTPYDTVYLDASGSVDSDTPRREPLI